MASRWLLYSTFWRSRWRRWPVSASAVLERMVNPALSEGLPGIPGARRGAAFGLHGDAGDGGRKLVSANKILAHPASVDFDYHQRE